MTAVRNTNPARAGPCTLQKPGSGTSSTVRSSSTAGASCPAGALGSVADVIGRQLTKSVRGHPAPRAPDTPGGSGLAHADDGGVQALAPGGSAELGVAEVEDAAVAG